MRPLAVLLLIILLLGTPVLTQLPAAQDLKTVETQKANENPAFTNARQPSEARSAIVHGESSTMTRFEYWLSFEVLVFGALVICLQYANSKQLGYSAQDGLRMYSVSLILVGTLFIITAGFGSTQIAPAMGLFGTVAGYLLGKSESRPKESQVGSTPENRS